MKVRTPLVFWHNFRRASRGQKILRKNKHPIVCVTGPCICMNRCGNETSGISWLTSISHQNNICMHTCFLWKNSGIINCRSAMTNQANFIVNWNDNKSTWLLTKKGHKSYLEKLVNLSLKDRETEVKDISEEISPSLSRNVIVIWGFYLSKFREFNTSSIMYSFSYCLLCVLNNFI